MLAGKALLILSFRSQLCIHALPTLLSLSDPVYVSLLDMSVEVRRKIIFVETQSMPIAVDNLLIAVAFADVQEQYHFCKV